METRKQHIEKCISLLIAKANAAMYIPPSMEKLLNKYEAELSVINGRA